MDRGVVFADFDREGRIDAAVRAIGERIGLWWNRSPRKRWLQLRLNGKKSNRSASMGIWVPFEGEKETINPRLRHLDSVR